MPMSGEALIRELRKLRVYVIHPLDAACDELVRHLKRIGCQVHTLWPTPDRWPEQADVVFCVFRGYQVHDGVPVRIDRVGPLIGVIEHESPAVVRELIEADVQGVISKPIRPFGILSTLIIASSRYKFERQQSRKIGKLEETLRSRRVVNSAIQLLMRVRSMDEEQAYLCIRRWSLEARLSMTKVADLILTQGALLSDPDWHVAEQRRKNDDAQ